MTKNNYELFFTDKLSTYLHYSNHACVHFDKKMYT